jgi:hypothetical protein
VNRESWSVSLLGPWPLASGLGQATLQPPDRPIGRILRFIESGLPRDHMVELHDHVGAQVSLDLHHQLGREVVP